MKEKPQALEEEKLEAQLFRIRDSIDALNYRIKQLAEMYNNGKVKLEALRKEKKEIKDERDTIKGK